MSDKSWKALERKVAKALNSKRNPLSGGSSKHTRGDVIHETLYIEIKHRARFSILVLYRQVAALGKSENRIPVLVIKEKGKKGEVAVIDWELFCKLWGARGIGH